MPAPVTLTLYHDLAPDPRKHDQPRHHVTADGSVVWPCPRCATTLHVERGAFGTNHGCPDVVPSPSTARKATRERLVAAWWDAFEAVARLTACRKDHVPDGSVCTTATYSGLLALMPGEPYGYVATLPDDGPHPGSHGSMSPIQRAVLAARLRAWADHFAAPDAPQEAPQ